MDKKYTLPAASFLIGLALWIVFFFAFATTGKISQLPTGTAVIVCVLVGSLLVFSAAQCRSVGGPREGNLFRTILLTVMAGLTWWKADAEAAGILALAAIAAATLTCLKPIKSQRAVTKSMSH